MIKNKINHWISLTVLLLTMSFFFYKSIFSEIPFVTTLKTIEALQTQQAKLHRDVLGYRNSQIFQYDSLNKVTEQVRKASLDLDFPDSPDQFPAVTESIADIKATILHQGDLIEDFKTHNSILQNSLAYYARMSKEIYSSDRVNNKNKILDETLGQLSSLILEYTRVPKHKTALKIFPIIDSLNHNPTIEVNTLIIHSLTIIERLPEIDTTIKTFESLNTEQKLESIKEKINAIQFSRKDNARIFNALLFICSLYLVAYIILLFISLQKNKNTLTVANKNLNDEIGVRTKTEHTLFSFVEGTSYNNDDSICALLTSLSRSLNVRYAYLTYLSDDGKNATMVGLIDNENYLTDLPCTLTNSPCEEVLRDGRLVFNRDLDKYFPEWSQGGMIQAESYIGVRMHDSNNKIKGLLAIADDSPIENTNLAESILTLAASRASIELLRQTALSKSKRYQDGLELIDKWAARLVLTGKNSRQFYEKTCLAAQEITGAILATIPIIDHDNNTYSFVASIGHNSDALEDMEMSVNDGGICSWSMSNKCNLRVDDVNNDVRAKKQLVDKLDIKSVMITPVIIGAECIGALVVFRRQTPFDAVDEQLLTQFSQSVRMAILNMQLLNDIEAERERAEITLFSIADAVITTNVDGGVEYMNHAAEHLSGWRLHEAKNKPIQNVFRILDRETREPMHNLIEACLEDGTSINKSMTTLVSNGGAEKEIECSMSPILIAESRPDGAVIVFHDETERRQMESVIMHQATHDGLTGLSNRNEFDKQLTEHIYDAKNYNKEHALCYLDLDRFKLVNDTCGHAAGDDLLKQITKILSSCIRGGDVLGRLGGDEFGLILGNCPQSAAIMIANKITKEISDYQYSWDEQTFSIGVSIGLVPITTDTESTAETIKQADLACYAAKDLGRNNVYVYEDEDKELMRRQKELMWVNRIEDALKNNRFRLHAQIIYPISESEHSRTHLEILVRMENETGELVYPDSFIPAAERFNLMGKIDQRIIHDTFEFIASRKYDRENICYSINLSGNSLNNESLAQYIKSKLDEFKIKSEHVCFEITETAAITNLHLAKKLMTELRSIGCYFALDDFGSGLSSFEYLKNLPVDFLKIDGCFVRDMVDNKIDQAMVAAINQIGHVMNIKTIAEFVESDEIIDKLKTMNVDYAQGYAIARPIALTDIDFDKISSNSHLRLVTP